MEKRLIQIYTTPSERMNLAPLGLGLRASGHRLHTLIACFTSHALLEGAQTASSLLRPYLSVEIFAGGNHARLSEGFERCRKAILGQEFDIVVLNGIHRLWEEKAVPLEDILRLMEKRPKEVELVLSGSRIPEQVLQRGDLITEMLVEGLGESASHTDNHHLIPRTEVITGDAKGKTTYCLGKAMLASCMGIRSLVLQFIKSPNKTYGEVKAVRKLAHMEIRSMGKGLFGKGSSERDRHQEAAWRAWKKSIEGIFSLEYGLIVLDEISIATYYGLVPGEALRDALLMKPPDLHLLLSGRRAHFEVRELASCVIEMKEIRHPYRKGIKARKGIEF